MRQTPVTYYLLCFLNDMMILYQHTPIKGHNKQLRYEEMFFVPHYMVGLLLCRGHTTLPQGVLITIV